MSISTTPSIMQKQAAQQASLRERTFPQTRDTTSGDNTSSGDGTSSGGGSSSGDNSILGGNPSHSGGNTNKEPTKDPNMLDKDAFLKLFLEQLKAQDPTAPMETNQILEQSAMMTQIEQQQQMKETLANMTDSIKQMSESSKKLTEMQAEMSKVLTSLSENIGENTAISNIIAQLGAYNASGVVGKIAETSFTGIEMAESDLGKKQTFDMYFDEKVDISSNEHAKVIIKDKDGGVVKEILLKDYKDADGNPIDWSKKTPGYVTFEWDGKDKSGINVPKGAYTIEAEYNMEKDGKTPKKTRIGRGEVTGLAFINGVPLLKLGTSNSDRNYYSIFGATQFYSKGGSSTTPPPFTDHVNPPTAPGIHPRRA